MELCSGCCLLCLKGVEGSQDLKDLSDLCQLLGSSHNNSQPPITSQTTLWPLINGKYNVCADCSEITAQAQSLKSQLESIKRDFESKVKEIREKIVESNLQPLVYLGSYENLKEYRSLILEISLPLNPREYNEDGSMVQVKLETDEGPLPLFSSEEEDEGTDELFWGLGQEITSVKEEAQDAGLTSGDERSSEGEDEEGPVIRPFVQRRSARTSKNSLLVDKRSKEGGSERLKKGSRQMPPRKSKVDRKLNAMKKCMGSESSENCDEMESVKEQCAQCDKSFRTKYAMERHRKRVHAKLVDKYPCNLCEKTFSRLSHRKEHEVRDHKGEATHPCPLCPLKFYCGETLGAHMFISHESDTKPLSCPHCSKTFTLQQNLDRHISLHALSSEKPHVCPVCDGRFASDSLLELHLATHNLKKHQCPHCEKAYSSRTPYLRHVRIHTGEKPFECIVCGEKFIDRTAVIYHKQKVHSNPEEHFVCPFCSRKFFSKSILKSHVERHEGKNYPCLDCEMKFNDPGALKTHRISLHGEDPIICDECGSIFMTSKGLKQHKMKHAGVKPHECEFCHKKFISKYVLDNHLRVHTGERPFVCEHCGKGFKAKKHLEYHVQTIHSPDWVQKTPWTCTQCGKSYPRKGILEGHIRQVHTGERPFKCGFCDKAFALKTTLQLHLRSHGVVSKGNERLPRSTRDFNKGNKAGGSRGTLRDGQVEGGGAGTSGGKSVQVGGGVGVALGLGELGSWK